MKAITHINWASVITAALSGIGGGAMLGGSLFGFSGAVTGGLVGAIVCGLAEVNSEKRIRGEQNM
ncbi:hypothetical protein [Dyadobacter sp. CY343]|uniref:hypothetical protein n=1 Tax=Dyadobacter sp. CY343 TaxID=2907299 RepID=UPI001F2F61A0|nr:hypothetical protein [Dyadobacter sp. CY343]MCE7058526.1 hypothetical protein [Dyadobacter sp. CY343]